MIDREHDLSITKQAAALNISRGSVYYLSRPVSASDLEVMRRLDRLHLQFPFAGSRMLRGLLAAEGCKIGRRHVKTLMKRMRIEALYRRPRTTKPEPGHKIYPYLLRGSQSCDHSNDACSKKNRIISRLASGPQGSVYDPAVLPPDHACPPPCNTHCSRTGRPLSPMNMVRV